jgi:hypothetical protein
MELLSVDLELPAAAGEIVFPRFTGEQDSDTTVGIDTEDCDVSILVEPEIDPDALTAAKDRRVPPVRPQLDTWAVDSRVPASGRRQNGETE